MTNSPRVEHSTITVLIGFAIIIGGIIVGTQPLGLQAATATGIAIAAGLVGGGLAAVSLYVKARPRKK